MNDEFVPCFEGPLSQMRELERQLLAQEIEVELAKPPPKACCAGGCGCGGKLQLLVHKEDVARVAQLMQAQWTDALSREGTGGLVQLGTPPGEEGAEAGEPPCPACGFVGPYVAGACGDCGLQLE